MDWILLVLICFAVWFGYRVSKVGWMAAKAEVVGLVAAVGAALGKMWGAFS